MVRDRSFDEGCGTNAFFMSYESLNHTHQFYHGNFTTNNCANPCVRPE